MKITNIGARILESAKATSDLTISSAAKMDTTGAIKLNNAFLTATTVAIPSTVNTIQEVTSVVKIRIHLITQIIAIAALLFILTILSLFQNAKLLL